MRAGPRTGGGTAGATGAHGYPAADAARTGTTAVISALAGGVGAARFLRGLVEVVPADEITAVVNTGDDTELHGLHISPDLDTVLYTLAGAINPETGWGLAGETWRVMESLEKLGGLTWFRLGDRDLATHCYRTQRLSEGAALHEVTAELCRAWGVGVAHRPGDRRSRPHPPPAGRRARGRLPGVLRPAAATTWPSPASASTAPIGPGPRPACSGPSTPPRSSSSARPTRSCPSVRSWPCPGVRERLQAARDRVVGISPIVAGAALKGPADRLMRELGHESSVVGVARWYAEWVGTLVIDEADAELAAAVEAEGVRCVVAADRHVLHRTVGRAGPGRPRCRRLTPATCKAQPGAICVLPVTGMGEVRPGDDLAALLADAMRAGAHRRTPTAAPAGRWATRSARAA